MPWDGSGNFSLNQNFPLDRDLGVPDAYIDADKVDDELQNIKSGIENALALDGQNEPSANISWGTKRLMSLGAATAATDAPTAQQVGRGQLDWGGTFGGTANALTCTLAFTPVTLVAGQRIRGILSATNDSTTVTLAVNGGAAKAVVTLDGSTLPPVGTLVSGKPAVFEYDGTKFRIVSAIDTVSVAAGSAKITVTPSAGVYSVDLGTVAISAITGLQAALDAKVLQSAFDAVFIPAAAGNAGTMSAADKVKLDAIESGATADMTGAEIVSAIDTNLGDTDWRTPAVALTAQQTVDAIQADSAAQLDLGAGIVDAGTAIGSVKLVVWTNASDQSSSRGQTYPASGVGSTWGTLIDSEIASQLGGTATWTWKMVSGGGAPNGSGAYTMAGLFQRKT